MKMTTPLARYCRRTKDRPQPIDGSARSIGKSQRVCHKVSESVHDMSTIGGTAKAASARAPDPLCSVAAAGVRHVGKRFGGTIALDDVSFNLTRGEVLALLGENGAGKSTCVKLLAGVYRPDVGDVLVEGVPVEHWSPLEAQRRGIAVMHQHP